MYLCRVSRGESLSAKCFPYKKCISIAAFSGIYNLYVVLLALCVVYIAS